MLLANIPNIFAVSLFFCTDFMSFFVCEELTLNRPRSKQQVQELWSSTGFSPPSDFQHFKNFSLSDQFHQNILMLGALPLIGLQIRVHWLLNLVTYVHTSKKFDFTELDRFVGIIKRYGVDNIGFELMGNPSKIFTDFENDEQVWLWYQLVHSAVSRYKKYNREHEWNFESWNEPDHGDFDGLNFTAQGFFNYFDASEKGVHDADKFAKFGGPGASCRLTSFSKLCWGLLDHISCGRNYFTRRPGTRIDFFSMHKKGNDRDSVGSSTYLLKSEGLTLTKMKTEYSKVFNGLAIYNDEGDPMKSWWKPLEFRADVRYPAMVAKIIQLHLYDDDPLFAHYQMTSNDNAFLNYAPHYFTQRTMLTTFSVNTTNPSFSVNVRKPIYELWTMLPQIRGELLSTSLPSRRDFGVIASQTSNQLCLTFWLSNDTELYTGPGHNIRIRLPMRWVSGQYITRVLDNTTTNTYEKWKTLGFPANLTQQQLAALWNVTMVRVSQAKPVAASGSIRLTMTSPGVKQIIVCNGNETLSQPSSVQFHRINNSTLLIWWRDGPVSACFLSYDVQYKPPGSHDYAALNQEALLTRVYQRTSLAALRGSYRVRSRNILRQTSAFSDAAVYAG